MSSEDNDVNAEAAFRHQTEEMVNWYEAEYDEKWGDAVENLTDSILGITEYRQFDVCFATGGPARHFKFTVNEDNDVMEMSFWYYDWFYGKEFKISKHDEAWDAWEELANWVHDAMLSS
tara:strand:+ start:7020 stop:7376 length:357 start_codon:yes stop_codon:yes gene_type:complete